MVMIIASSVRWLVAGLLPATLVLASCSSGPEPAEGGGRTVTTALGEVTVPSTIDSVVVLEGRRDLDTALALGLPVRGFPYAGARIELPLPIADELAQARAAGAEQLFLSGETDVEAIAQAQPDLILGRLSDIEPIADELMQIAPVIPVRSHSDGVAWQDDLQLVARATGTEAKAEELIAEFDARLVAVSAAHSSAIAATPVVAVGYDMDGTEVEATRLQSVVLQELSARPSVAFAKAIEVGEVSYSPEQTLQAYGDADALLVMSESDEEWMAAQNDPLFIQLPAVQAGAIVRTDRMTHEGGPITALHVLDLLDELYGRVG